MKSLFKLLVFAQLLMGVASAQEWAYADINEPLSVLGIPQVYKIDMGLCGSHYNGIDIMVPTTSSQMEPSIKREFGASCEVIKTKKMSNNRGYVVSVSFQPQALALMKKCSVVLTTGDGRASVNLFYQE